jgi:hypothetical protein
MTIAQFTTWWMLWINPSPRRNQSTAIKVLVRAVPKLGSLDDETAFDAALAYGDAVDDARLRNLIGRKGLRWPGCKETARHKRDLAIQRTTIHLKPTTDSVTAMPLDFSPQRPDGLLRRMRAETQSWFSIFGLLLGIFVLFASITSLLHEMFDLPLLPDSQNNLDHFRRFTHILLDKTFYEPLVWLIGRIAYLTMYAVSRLVPFDPFVPPIFIQPWFRDVGLISLILLRAQTRAMAYSTPASTLTLSAEESLEWGRAMDSAPNYLRTSIRASWLLVLILYRIKKGFELPFRNLGLEPARKIVGLFVGGALMLSIAYFVHDILTAIATRHVVSGRAELHRSFLTWMFGSIVCALVASLSLYAWNGYMLE